MLVNTYLHICRLASMMGCMLDKLQVTHTAKGWWCALNRTSRITQQHTTKLGATDRLQSSKICFIIQSFGDLFAYPIDFFKMFFFRTHV